MISSSSLVEVRPNTWFELTAENRIAPLAFSSGFRQEEKG